MTDSSGHSLTIDCDECTLRHSDACADCLVTFLCAAEEPVGATPVVVEATEARAMRLLAGAGLVPHLRLVRSGPAA